jgi:glycosyltransferase involved in cell wall biosynthesis
MPLFSVIIPTFNRAALLERALDSVWRQTFRDFEVIVVDDGSTDSTDLVLERFADRLVAVRQENAGPSAARNRGAALATGEYLAFLDSDDLWFPWTLATYAKAIGEHQRPASVMGAWLRFSRDEQLKVQQEALTVTEYPDFLHAGQVPLFWGTGIVIVRATELRTIGGFSGKIRVFEDQDLGLRLGIRPRFLKIESPITVAYRDTPGSLTTCTRHSVEGILYLVEQERLGRYPGGLPRRNDRRRYIAYTVRSQSVGLLRAGQCRDAGRLYWKTVSWHLVLGRVRYLLGFPLAWCAAAIRNRLCRSARSVDDTPR